jgi:hypothetical protein
VAAAADVIVLAAGVPALQQLLRSSPVLAAAGTLVQNKFVFVVQALGCDALQCLLQQLLRSSPELAAAGTLVHNKFVFVAQALSCDALQCLLQQLLRSSPVLAAAGTWVHNKFVFVAQALGCDALQCLLQQLLQSSPVRAAAGESSDCWQCCTISVFPLAVPITAYASALADALRGVMSQLQ